MERRSRGDDVQLNEDDAFLIERTQRGDQQAFEELVRRYQTVAFRVAYVVTGSAEEAQDAAQEGFIRAYRSIGRFDRGRPFRPWLMRIVANAARTRQGKRGREFALTLNEGSVGEAAAGSVESPEAAAIADEAIGELIAVMRSLRLEDQQVIALRYFLELSEAEMATVIHCARGTVKSRLSRALGRLRAALVASSREGPDA